MRRAPGTASNDQVTVAIAVHAGTNTLHVNGKGTCTRAPRGSMFGTLAQMWSIQGSEGQRSAALTVWKTSSGANMFSLALSATSPSTLWQFDGERRSRIVRRADVYVSAVSRDDGERNEEPKADVVRQTLLGAASERFKH